MGRPVLPWSTPNGGLHGTSVDQLEDRRSSPSSWKTSTAHRSNVCRGTVRHNTGTIRHAEHRHQVRGVRNSPPRQISPSSYGSVFSRRRLQVLSRDSGGLGTPAIDSSDARDVGSPIAVGACLDHRILTEGPVSWGAN